jgi:D-3-phosphoglycerate dehydrogenase
VVEYVVALMIDVLRPRIALNRAIDSAEWNRLRAETVGRRQINELIIGILGMGRVGKGLARVASAIGCRVLYNDLLEIEPQHRSGGEPVDVEMLFAQSDVLSIHVDGRPANRGFVDARLIRKMKANVLFINTSRGFVVDNLTLAEFMRSHAQATACLDVHEPEPFGPQYPLLGLPNVRLYPHLASRTETAMRNMSWVVKDVWAVLEGRRPLFPAPQA